MADDETAWRDLLATHLHQNILPVLTQHSLEHLTASVEHQLHYLHGNSSSQCTHLPAECELLTVDGLHKFPRSFQAEIPPGDCGCSSDNEGGGLSGSHEPDGELSTLPAVLMGVVKPAEGGLVLVDATGSVRCEICAPVLTLNLIGQLVVLSQWNWICPHKGRDRRGYIEAMGLSSLPLDHTPVNDTLLSIAELKDAIKKKQLYRGAPLTVYGRVKALSETCRSCYWIVQLEDFHCPHITHPVLTQSAHLLHLSSVLAVSEVYLFTDLTDKLLHKGREDEQRVLVTTPTSQVHLYTDNGEPPAKRSRSEECSLGTSGLFQSFEESGRVSQEMVNEQKLVSYTGIITDCVLPEAGVYELDRAIRFYITHQTSPHCCRGLRNGARVELHNVHLLSFTPELKHLSGLVCCSVSTVRVSQFSTVDSYFTMYDSRNKLASFLRSYPAHLSAWLVDIYLTLRARQLGAQKVYLLLQTLSHALSLTPLHTHDLITEFLTHSSGCPLMTEMTPTPLPTLPSVRELLEEVNSAVRSHNFRWEQGEVMGGASGFSMNECYSMLTQHQLGGVKFLVGELRGDGASGVISLVDNTGHLPAAPTRDALRGFGAIVLITEFDLVVEKMHEDNIKSFISVKQLSVCETPAKEPINKLTVEILNKNVLCTDKAKKTHSFTALASVHTQPPLRVALNFSAKMLSLYPFICNEYLYEITSKLPLPSVQSLEARPVIEVTESIQLRFIRGEEERAVDVSELVSQCHLPPILTLKSRSIKSAASPTDKVVSVRGIVLSRGSRVDHHSLAQGPATPVLTVRLASSSCPDSIMLYCKDPSLQTTSLGLLPGCEATFHSFNLNISKAGNVYLTSNPSSSIVVHCLDGVWRGGGLKVGGVTPAMARLPTVLLHELTSRLLNGCLSRCAVCVQGRLVSTQRLCVQYKCRTCQCIVINGQCMVACLQRRPYLTADGRIVVDDGSGEAHVYAEDNLLQELLRVSVSDWRDVCELARSLGVLTYTKATAALYQKMPPAVGDCSPLSQAERKLQAIATSSSLQLPIKLYCQPFLSKAELGEGVLGAKTRAITVKDQRFTTLALPRLQLRALAVAPLEGVSCVSETMRLLQELLGSSGGQV